MAPPSGPVVALSGNFLMVLLLTPGALRSADREGPSAHQDKWKGLCGHPRTLALAVLIAGIAPLFCFTAIALGLVGNVMPLVYRTSLLTTLCPPLVLRSHTIV